MKEPIDLCDGPLSVVMIHRIIMDLCVDGEVHVVGCNKMGAGHAFWLLRIMCRSLSEADLEAIKQIVNLAVKQ